PAGVGVVPARGGSPLPPAAASPRVHNSDKMIDEEGNGKRSQPEKESLGQNESERKQEDDSNNQTVPGSSSSLATCRGAHNTSMSIVAQPTLPGSLPPPARADGGEVRVSLGAAEEEQICPPPSFPMALKPWWQRHLDLPVLEPLDLTSPEGARLHNLFT